MGSEPTREQAREELDRLVAKLHETTDEDIRSALQLKIDSLAPFVVAEEPATDEVAPAPEQVEPEVVEQEPPSPEAVEAAVRLLREARVEKMRGNHVKTKALMDQALSLAGNSSVVLEAQGDALAEASRFEEARDAYERAHKLDPTNVPLERKFAEAVLKCAAMGDIENQLRLALSDSLLPTDIDSTASIKTALCLNVLLPGAGTLVLGQTVRGGILLGSWILVMIWTAVMSEDFMKLVGYLTGKPTSPHMLVMVPLLLGLIIEVIGVVSLPKIPREKKAIVHPQPPADLPFE